MGSSDPPERQLMPRKEAPGSPFTNLSTFDTVRALILQEFWLARVMRRTWISA